MIIRTSAISRLVGTAIVATGVAVSGAALAQMPAHPPANPPSMDRGMGMESKPAPQMPGKPQEMNQGMGMGGEQKGMMDGMMPMMPMMRSMMKEMMAVPAKSDMGDPQTMMVQHTEGYLAFLKTELQITDAQGPAWTAYADIVRNLAQKSREVTPGMTAMPGMIATPATWPDRLATREKALTSQLDALKSMQSAATALYGVLTPEQKKKADELIR